MKLNHITIVVSDIERSKRFYKNLLGLTPIFEKTLLGSQYEKVTGFSNLKLRFSALKSVDSDVIIELAEFITPKQKIHKDFRHIAFEADDIEAVYKKTRKMKISCISEPVTISGHDAKLDGKRFFYCKDPDGNLIELFQRSKSLYDN